MQLVCARSGPHERADHDIAGELQDRRQTVPQAIFAGTPVREADSQQSVLQDRHRPGPNSLSERGVNIRGVAERSFLCRAIGISGAAPGTTCGNHRANSPRHLGAHSGMLFAVQTREPTRRSASSSVQHSMRSSSSRAGHMAKCVFPRSPAPRNEGHTTPRVRQLPSVTWRLATRTRAEGPHGCDGARRPHSRRRDEPEPSSSPGSTRWRKRSSTSDSMKRAG